MEPTQPNSEHHEAWDNAVLQRDTQIAQNIEATVAPKFSHTIPTRLGSLIILLTAVIAGSGVWWYGFSYEVPEPINVDQLIVQLHARRSVVENATTTQALPSDYEVKADGVYYRESLITDADPTTFQYLGHGYSKDKNHVFFINFLSKQVTLVNDADVDTFIPLTSSFKDDDYAYYAKDKDRVYLDDSVIPESDPRTFTVVGVCALYPSDHEFPLYYAKDKHHVYCGYSVVNADPITFDFVFVDGDNSIFAKDKDNVYYYGKVLKDIDKNTFTLVSKSYFKDKNHVYTFDDIFGINIIVVEGANPATCTADNLDGCKGTMK